MGLTFNTEQERAIFSHKPFVVLSAGAGSGKTRVLTERYIYVCEQKWKEKSLGIGHFGATVDEIVAITFTEKAAREMKDRIRSRLHERMNEAVENGEGELAEFWRVQKEKMDRATILTFHSFCQKLLTEYAMEAGLPPRISILDEKEAMLVKRGILKDLFQRSSLGESFDLLLQIFSKGQLIESIEALYGRIRELSSDPKIFARLNGREMLEKQKDALQTQKKQMIMAFHEKAKGCVEAFSGLSGLTKSMQDHVERIKALYPSVHPDMGPDEYIAKVEQMMPGRGHKSWAEKAPPLQEIYETHWKLLKEQWKSFSSATVIAPHLVHVLDHFLCVLQHFHLEYEEQKQRRGMLDFSDLQQKAVILLQKTAIQQACRLQFRHIMVDEFQDTNQLQMEVLRHIQPDYQFLVGDKKQSIYRFRGADVSLMREVGEQAKKREDAEYIEMSTNYRTSKPVIDVINSLFTSIMASKDETSDQMDYVPLVPARPSEKEGEQRVELIAIEENTEEEEGKQGQGESEMLANRLVEMMRSGTPRVFTEWGWQRPRWQDMAILIPARTHLLQLERALTEKGIPYIVYGGVGFYERQEITDFLSILQWLNRPFESLYLFSLLRGPLFGLTLDDLLGVQLQLQEQQTLPDYVLKGDYAHNEQLSLKVKKAFDKINQWLEQWVPFRAQPTLSSHLHLLFEASGLKTALLLQHNGVQKVKNVEKLIREIVSWRMLVLEDILEKLEQLKTLVSQEGEAEIELEEGDAVHIMTIHASKGLEFPIVCLPQLGRRPRSDKGKVRFDLNQGIVLQYEYEEEEEESPKKYESPGYALVKAQGEEEALAETKRLFYVATTRAKDYLLMIGTKSSSRHSWLSFIEEARDENPFLETAMLNTAHVDEQNPWQQEEQTHSLPPVMARSPKIERFSVSELMTFMKSPTLYYETYVLGIHSLFQANGETSKASPVQPSTLGTLVHRACELRDYGFTTEEAIEEAIASSEQELEEKAYRDEMIELMENYHDGIIAELGEPVANEWSFSVEVEGAEIVGEIDKIVRKDEKAHLIDFKTNQIWRSGKELFSYYEPQLYLYKLAYEQETGEAVGSLCLYVLRDKKEPLHILPQEKGAEEEVREAIRKLVHLRQTNANRSEYEQIERK
ncbi:UvrD-helicase domain-containing protein [Halalkalibacterium ligniniphilum]|uniref:UvrD-helicase domain-containing protein n=1 Tax=Halalkalibacterium ligniniphilum TaxID=1134413 RepID=UPI00034CF7D3|nr:UvrD-helicase domain-containing protein [Halalkalibacterium ligniniphilum]